MNNLIDNETRSILSSWRDVSPVSLVRGIIVPIISNEDMIRYYNLVTLGGNKI